MAYKRATSMPVAEGGTGANTLTDHGVLIGSGTGAITPLGSATHGQLVIGSTGADPVLAVPINGTNITWTAGAGTLTANLVATVDVTLGGTGATTLTDHGILLGSGVGAITPLGVASNGQIPIGSAGADPVLATITAGTNIQVTNGAGTITIDTIGTASFGWVESAVDGNIVVNTGYIANKAGLLTLTLPATAVQGSIIEFTNINTAVGVRVAQNANQSIRFGASTTAVGIAGYIEATALGDSVKLVCTVAGASTRWQVISSVGNWTIA